MMKSSKYSGPMVLFAVACLSTLSGCATSAGHDKGSEMTLTPSSMPRIGTIDERYQSYNVELLEVTGGKFWKPYSGASSSTAAKQPPAKSASGDTPAGMNPDAYAYRPPIDLSNSRRRKL